MGDITEAIRRLGADDPQAEADLLQLVYAQLRDLARGYARGGRAPTLQATELVHEAWLRLARAPDPRWTGRGHFMAVAATAMRQILVDRARRRGSQKRGGDWAQVTLTGVGAHAGSDPAELLALDRAIAELATLDPRRAQVVEMRAFAGMTHPEIADALGVGLRTVEKDWRLARAWLAQALSARDPR